MEGVDDTMCVVGGTESNAAAGGGGATPSVAGDVAAVSEPLSTSTCVEATYGTIRLAKDPLERSNRRGKFDWIFSPCSYSHGRLLHCCS